MLAAARRLADERGQVTLAALQADAQVQSFVMSAPRVTDIMKTLEEQQQVRMICRHPQPTWQMEEAA
jgi:hypothetical protein